MSVSTIWSVASAVLAAIGGGAALVLLFSSWLGKVWASRILSKESAEYAKELETLKRGLESQLHAGRSLFDAEFGIYRELWAHASRIRLLAQNLEPWHLQSTITDAERRSVSEGFTAELIAFDDYAEATRPFFSPDIYVCVQELVEACRAERTRFAREAELQHMERLKNRSESMMRLSSAGEELCEAIRSRLYASQAPNNSFKPNPLRGSA